MVEFHSWLCENVPVSNELLVPPSREHLHCSNLRLMHNFGVRQCFRHVSRNAVGMVPEVAGVFQHCSYVNVFTWSGIRRVPVSFYVQTSYQQTLSLVCESPNDDLPSWETRSGDFTVNSVSARSLPCFSQTHTLFPKRNLLLCHDVYAISRPTFCNRLSFISLCFWLCVWKRMWIQ